MSELEKSTRRGFLRKITTAVGAGIAARELFKARPVRAQEDPLPPMDITEPEVGGVVAEAPLSPVEQLLANTELIDAVYLGHTPVAEFRTTPDSPFMLSINPEVSEEDRNKFAELVGKSGQHFSFDTLEFVVMTDEEFINIDQVQPSTDSRGDYYRYNGVNVRLGSFGTINDESSRKLIFKFGYSNQITRFLNDPEFVSKTILPKNMIAVWNMVSKGDQNYMGGNPKNPKLDEEVQSLIHDNFLVFSTK